jgi:hypothetical protein
MTSAITGAGALTTAVYTVYATATTNCDSPPRLLARSRIRREAGTGRLDGTGL